MSTNKHIDKICCVVMILTIIITALFCNGEKLGIEASAGTMGYENKLFDTSYVHTIDIVMDDWDEFIEGCEDEEYVSCAVVIDNEAYKNVGIRAKGNTSLSSVSAYGNNRYSFKIEFDHYDSSKSYYGLDKLSLNNIIQDNTYMKDYLSYQMMTYMGVAASLCSYVYITVNGEDFGLYLAVEGVEESFLQRNYGTDYGELYKPDSMSMGGGKGNGKDIDMDELAEEIENGFNRDGGTATEADADTGGGFGGDMPEAPSGGQGFGGDMPEAPDDNGQNFGEASQDMENGGGMGGMGSDDVSLVYTDDDYDSYCNIFDNAKTDISDDDKDRLIDSLKQLNEDEDIEEVVDVDSVIKYFVVHNFVCNFDSYTGSMIHNYYLYEEDGVLSMIPWDYNLAFGGFSMGGGSDSDATELVNYPIDTPVSGGTVDSRPMLAWIFSDEEYTELYHEYFDEFISTYFESGIFEQFIDETYEMIAPYVEEDPTSFCTYEEFETGVSALKEFCLLRAESIRGQLDGTIPSTESGQKEDNSSLTDASDINISDMGSMGNMGGGNSGMPQGEDRFDGDGGFPQDGGGNMPQEGMPQEGMPQEGTPPDVNIN